MPPRASCWFSSPVCQRCCRDGWRQLPCCTPRGEVQHVGSPRAVIVVIGQGGLLTLISCILLLSLAWSVLRSACQAWRCLAFSLR